MSVVSPDRDQRVVLHNVSWSTYQALLADLGDHRGRLTYDRGTLEIMSPSYKHENAKRMIGRLIEALTEELDIEVASAGSTTLQREDVQQGIEPDECYYLGDTAAIREKQDIQLPDDRPPDLAVEVDVSSSSLKRHEMYANLGIPEVWRYDGETLVVYRLQENRQYAISPQSSALPDVPMDEFARFLGQRKLVGETQIVKSFRAWVRENLTNK